MHINWPIVLAFTKALLGFAGAASWPGAAAIIAFQFREPITGAIERARRLSAFGVEADLPANPQLAGVGDDHVPPAVEISASQLSVSPQPPFDVVLSPKDDWVRSFIEKEPLTVEQKYAWAVRARSETKLSGISGLA
ncbi:hypothetical protein [Sphingomonas sp. 10B4]|uniref:hypothetical protein n=1 Tax=Sphingomonas sp. 10B4 TaxID=3048575 RepID=UPI002AB413B9|nr:hypothetical protein [Sphingomonas sp. 10B4]MDY7525355.1 hypothetical protein [Sphingomonas sp. 10B4]MEB0284628.1 hypothetical protein [Sphingomonas sp. 10B4]